MAQIAFTVTMTDGTVMAKAATVADADVARLLGAFATKYIPSAGVVADAPWLVEKWIEDTVVTAMQFVRSHEASVASANAANAVQLINFTLT